MFNSFVRVFLLLVFSVFSAKSFALDLACSHVLPVQLRFLSRHVYHTQMNKNLESRTIDQFVKHLDPSKIYFTQADVETIKKNMTGIFDRSKKGDCAPIFTVYDLFKKRVEENVEFAKKHLTKDFKFDPKTKLLIDSDKRKFAKNKKESEEFQKKYIQLQVANYIATDVKPEEAREKVLKNYERALKRMSEDKPKDVLANYLHSFATALDPHSTYWSRDAYEEFEISIRLSLEGIGATLSSKDGFTTVEQLIPGGSAEKSGLVKPKDKIVAVAQGEGAFDDVIDQELRDVVKKIRGPKGTKVRLKILRLTPEGNKNLEISLVRDKISIEDEAASITYIDKESNGKKIKVGLINLPSFYADNRTMEKSSATDMKKLLKEAREKGVDSIMLDLSGNGGGSLQDAVEIAGLFFREGNVVKQSSRDPINGEATLFDRDPLVDWAGPLVILTSRVTASASEIVSGTLQDYHRAVVVGADHTFGKGTVQAVEDLRDKLGALKTTIGLYFIPGGSSTQHVGVKSDIQLPSTLSATEEIGEKTLDYSLPPKAIKPFKSAEAFVPSGPGAWTMIDKKTVTALKAKSDLRVKSNLDFKKINDDIAKAKKQSAAGEIALSDFLKQREDSTKEFKEDEGKTYAESKQARKERYMKRADIQEAMQIAADLAAMQGAGVAVGLGAEIKTASEGKEKAK